MKKMMMVLLVTLVTGINSGCATVDRGEDEVLVRSEQAAGIIYTTMDTYLIYAEANRDSLSADEVALANKIQIWGKNWLKHMHLAIQDYERSGDEGYRIIFLNYLSKLDDILLEIRAMEASR